MSLWIMFLVFCLLVVTASSISEDDDNGHSAGVTLQQHWGYNNEEEWTSLFEQCGGESQSPVNIDTATVSYDPALPGIRLEGYDLTHRATLTLVNNGHTLQMTLPSSSMRITRGFQQVYLAAQLHFHWGTMEVPGSEHSVDGTRFPAEIHIVHYNSRYPSLAEAAKEEDGLAVLGGFITVGLHQNDHYENILSALRNISKEDSFTVIPGFNVRHLLPNSLERFYRYDGSLTTPPCLQTVRWTVFNDSVAVSRRQLAILEDALRTKQGKLLSKNFRSSQHLQGRKVLRSFQTAANEGKFRETPGAETPGTDAKKSNINHWHVLTFTFLLLFILTLLVFSTYMYRQRKKYSTLKPGVTYKPAARDQAEDPVTSAAV